MKRKNYNSVQIQPSVFYKREQEEAKEKEKEKVKLQQSQKIKSKEYDIYGKRRNLKGTQELLRMSSSGFKLGLNPVQNNRLCQYNNYCVKKNHNNSGISKIQEYTVENDSIIQSIDNRKRDQFQQLNMRYIETEFESNVTARVNLKNNYTVIQPKLHSLSYAELKNMSYIQEKRLKNSIVQHQQIIPFSSLEARKQTLYTPLVQKSQDISFSFEKYFQRKYASIDLIKEKSDVSKNKGGIKDFFFSHNEVKFPIFCFNNFFLQQSEEVTQSLYSFQIMFQNVNLCQERITLRLPKKYPKLFSISLSKYGFISPGLNNTITVKFLPKYAESLEGLIEDQFQIITKQKIYTFPIISYLLTQSQFEEQKEAIENEIHKYIRKNKLNQLEVLHNDQEQSLMCPIANNFNRNWELDPNKTPEHKKKKKKKKRNSDLYGYDDQDEDEDDEDEEEEEFYKNNYKK